MPRGVNRRTGRGANWRGGRTVTSHGYVLVWVGKGHPLADVRGYAYEHRLVAAKRQPLRRGDGQIVHHEDRNKQNNATPNLEVLGRAEHHLKHRRSENRDRLRKPGEPNPQIACACGCGTKLQKYDAQGRPRRYVSGHNARKRERP